MEGISRDKCSLFSQQYSTKELPNRTNPCIAKLDRVVMVTGISEVQGTPHLLHYLKMEVACFSEIFAATYRTVQCHSPKDSNIVRRNASLNCTKCQFQVQYVNPVCLNKPLF